ncbi:thiamine pyrophosphate-binding protein [Acidisoma silvae]|uniref:Thiamine pyrophosphate-binding protein n=1 Tax=Acidisoma silvae TaxID=2802396 RepID=A0A963YW11_9PROT|nr:thiamine pyrophosphate-binding protein [Acidisoma silvae]MCB8877392.1 thiamine pyrophosphate-binding protein [Acidisoma silvae]
MNGSQDRHEVSGLPTTARDLRYGRSDGATLLAKTLRNQAVDIVFIMEGCENAAVHFAFSGVGIRLIALPTASLVLSVADSYSRITGRLACALIYRKLDISTALSAMVFASLAESSILILTGRAFLNRPEDAATGDARQTDAISALTKFSGVVATVDALANIITRASLEALKDRPGLAYLELEAGLFNQDASVEPAFSADKIASSETRLYDEGAAQTVAMRIMSSMRPCILFGQGLWNPEARKTAQEFCRKLNVPGYASRFAGEIFPPDDQYQIFYSLHHALTRADLVIVLGALPNLLSSRGDTTIPGPSLVQISHGNEVFDPADDFALPLFDESRLLRATLETLGYAEDDGGAEREPWLDELHEAEQQTRAVLTSTFQSHAQSIHINDLLSEITIFAKSTTTLIYDPCLGLEPVDIRAAPGRFNVKLAPVPGMGVPLVLAADLARPGTEILCLTNASSFRASGFDLELCVRRSIAAIFLIYESPVSNAGGRPDFTNVGKERPPHNAIARLPVVEFARLLGASGERVHDSSNIQAALQRARSYGKCTVIYISATSVQLNTP